MNIKIEFIGFLVIYDLFPEGSHAYDFSGKTLQELIQNLIQQNEVRVKESLLDPRTQSLDPAIQVTINGIFIPRDKTADHEIAEGDHITFLKLLAGG
jgi:sulfur carrier protein ThiS